MKRISAVFISITIAALSIITFTVPTSAKKAAPPPDVVSPVSHVPAFKKTKQHTKANIATNKAKKSNTATPEADFSFDPVTQTILGYVGGDAVVDIPSSINGVAVLHIGEQAFVTLPVTSVTIPNGVKSIDDGAFALCSALTNISLPDSVTKIGEAAFFECSALENIALPPQLETIGTSAFQYCYALKSIVIPNSVKTLGNAAFYWCFALEELTLSNQITVIDEFTFELCPIKIINIPDSVKEVNYHAFWATSVTESLTLSKNLEYIGEQAFYYMPLLTSLEIPDSVLYIDTGAFMYAQGLTSLALPKNLTYIGSTAFSQCDLLESVTIPENVTTLGDRAFCYCDALKSATFTGNVPGTWGAEIFLGTAADFSIYYYAEKGGFFTPTFNGYPCYPLYKVSVAPTTGGVVAASTERAEAGNIVTVTVTPDASYLVKAVYYTDITGKHDIINNSFVMPESAVTVTAEFEFNTLLAAFTALVITFFLAALAYVIWLIVRRYSL